MKIACDVNVSNRSVRFLEREGFVVVFKAAAGQPDVEWFEQALVAGADVFISGDLDIAFLVEKQYDKRLKWLNFPNLPYTEGQANNYLLKRLTKFKEIWGL